jgi:hypothetical protein
MRHAVIVNYNSISNVKMFCRFCLAVATGIETNGLVGIDKQIDLVNPPGCARFFAAAAGGAGLLFWACGKGLQKSAFKPLRYSGPG